MQGTAVHATEMSMVGADGLVLFEIPAAHLLVLAGREHVGMAIADSEAAHRVDVAREGQLASTARKVPQLLMRY